MRRLIALLLVLPLVVAACGTSDTEIQQDEVGSTQQAIDETPTGIADCGPYPVPRRMSQYVNIIEADALPEYIANPIDTGCKLAVATLIETVPECETGTPEDRQKVAQLTERIRKEIESGVPPDQAYALIRDEARELAERKAC